MAGDTLGVSLQPAMPDTLEKEQNVEDTEDAEPVSDELLTGSNTDAAIPDTDSIVSGNLHSIPDTDIVTPDLSCSTPDTNSSDNKSSADTAILQNQSVNNSETNTELSAPLGSELISPHAGEEDFILSGTTLTSYTGTDEEVIIPEGATRIGRDAFKNNTAIRRVVLPESCDYIQYAIFSNCTCLEESRPHHQAQSKSPDISIVSRPITATIMLILPLRQKTHRQEIYQQT